MKVFITGGAGYIGYSLVHSLEKDDRIKEIVVYDNLYRNNLNFFTTGEIRSKVTFVKGDILDDYTIGQHLTDSTVIVHLAAHVDFPYSYRDNYLYEQINHFGTANLINQLRNIKPQKLVYLSSGAVYGYQTNADEDTEPLPENAYGKSKYNAEKYCHLLSKHCDVDIFRVGNVFGYNPMVRQDSVINKFILDALVYNKITIYGNGEQTRPFVSLQNTIEKLHDSIVEKGTAKLTNIVDANVNMNYLRDFIIELIPDLEFTYVNTNQSLKGYKMTSKYYTTKGDFKEDLISTFHTFRDIFKVKK